MARVRVSPAVLGEEQDEMLSHAVQTAMLTIVVGWGLRVQDCECD